ncbi:MAG: M20/M25/M40 family metallo-hydrolase, partial [Bacteroidales bacterium]|nr:M20/M25/M40 family metallo-hydrolase [Bacteroidales bacterium]
MEQLHNLTQFACNILKEMLQIESYSFNEGKRADFLCNILSSAFKEYKGVVIERIENNILLYNKDTYSSDKKTLMLNSHIDTVTPASTYTFNPHSPFEKDGAIYGLGSNDDGGSVVSQIAAFMHLCNSDLNVNLVLLLSAEEERSGANGIALAINKMDIKPDFAIIGEPTGMKAAIAERGLLVIDGTATSVSG